jgi:tetratricopeptide (TPR) repeat protein
VRITAQLINAADGFHLWAERFDRKLEDVFAVQEEIASSIAGALRVALTPREVEEIKRERPSNARAYDLYLKGREQYGRYTPESLQAALEIFQQAIEVEPEYALAWAGVADVYGQFRQWGADDSGGHMLRQGLQAARRAIAIDPKLPEAHKAESLVLRGLGEREAGTAALERALEIDPRFTPALMNLVVVHFERGDVARAERLNRRTLQVDPQEPFALLWLTQILDATGRHEEVLTVAAELMRVTTNPFYTNGARAMIVLANLALGRVAEAATEFESHGSITHSGNLDLMRAIFAHDAGDRARAGELVERAEASPQLAPVLVYYAAGIVTSLGNRQLARRLINRTITRAQSPVRVRIKPDLWPLADEPPFAPKRSYMTLVWPAEAPPPKPGTEEFFAAVRFESGLP